MFKFWKISESGFPNGLPIRCDREDLGMTLRFVSWTTRSLNLQSTEIWKKQFLGEDQKFSSEPDRFDITVRCA